MSNWWRCCSRTAHGARAASSAAPISALLLAHGAWWNERNGYGGNALGSCLHAGVNEPVPGGDYAAVLSLLLAAGAPVPQPEPHWPDALATVAEQAAACADSPASMTPWG